jgi:hypothetical protein
MSTKARLVGVEGYDKPKAREDWQGWKDRIWTKMHRGLDQPSVVVEPNTLPVAAPGVEMAGMACTEQYLWRSGKERRCVECGDPGTVQFKSELIASVASYWLWAECNAWYEHKRWVKRSLAKCFPLPLPEAQP